MKLGDLRKSLSRFPADMDDVEILFKIDEDYRLFCFVGYVVQPCCIIFGDEAAAVAIKKKSPGTENFQ